MYWKRVSWKVTAFLSNLGVVEDLIPIQDNFGKEHIIEITQLRFNQIYYVNPVLCHYNIQQGDFTFIDLALHRIFPPVSLRVGQRLEEEQIYHI